VIRDAEHHARRHPQSEGMKPRHAAALALVGWYLMVPPRVYNAGNMLHIEIKAPLSKWERWGSFDSGRA
jgi:hypothetical protein